MEKQLQEVLEKHQAWLNDEPGGERANLAGANLARADLAGAHLRDAHLRDACLRGADLSGADLRGADLSGAHLMGADLRGADLELAHLSGALLLPDTPIGYVRQIGGWRWYVTATEPLLIIGCERHTWEEWAAFSDEQITAMHKDAIAFWREHKELIFKLRKA